MREKPMDRRLEEAACQYWEVSLSFFRLRSRKTRDANKRAILFWLLYNEVNMNYEEIADRYELSRVAVRAAVIKIDFQKDIFTNISRDAENIKKMAQAVV
jgi:DNA-binding transcriptional regulator LsrR (DeoR family)